MPDPPTPRLHRDRDPPTLGPLRDKGEEERAMEKISDLGCLAIGFTMLGAYVQAQPIEIKTLDNIDGMSRATTAVGPGLVAQVEVANQVGNCRLRAFFVAPGLISKVDPDAAYVKPADEIKD